MTSLLQLRSRERTGATDVGPAAVERLEQVADALAIAYHSTPPAVLVEHAGRCVGYVTGLLGTRMTLAEHKRLLVVTGWLSLLAATSLTDLGNDGAAAAHLANAAQIGVEAGHPELSAWVLETRAWQAFAGGRHEEAAALSAGAQEAAPDGGSALIQATAQEGRAWAKVGDATRTREILARIERLVSPLPQPGDDAGADR